MTARTFTLILALASMTLSPGTGAAEPEPSPAERATFQDIAIEEAIADLGSADWSEREKAQATILEAGAPAVPGLERAAASENPEVAYRARFLLGRIDPEVTEFTFLKVETSGTPRIAAVAGIFGSDGRELLARPTSGDPDAFTFAITYVCLPGGLIDVEVSRSYPGGDRVQLPKPLAQVGSVSLLDRSEECTYRRLGIELHRERKRFVTLLLTRRGRCSEVARYPAVNGEAGSLDSLVDSLISQTSDTLPAARREAVKILGEIGSRRASSTLREALRDPRLAVAAASGLGDTDALAAIVEGAASQEEDAPGIEDGLRAAARLLEVGDTRGLRFILENLGVASGLDLHRILSALSDTIERGLEPGTRRLILASLLSADALSHLPWQDVESDYLLARTLELLDPSDVEDGKTAEAFLSAVERLAAGDIHPSRPPITTCVELWRRAARRIPAEPAPSLPAFLLRILPYMDDAVAFGSVMDLIEETLLLGGSAPAGRPDRGSKALSSEDLKWLLDVILEKVQSVDPALSSRSHQWLLRLSRAIAPAAGQVHLVVTALVEAGEASAVRPDSGVPGQDSTFRLRQTEQELQRWTGVAAVRSKGPDAPAFNGAPWREWLAREDAVEARESSLARESAAAAETASQGTFAYYAFLLEVHDPPPTGSRRPPAPFEVLDASRLEVPARRKTQVRDRRGNERSILLEPENRQLGGSVIRLNGKVTLLAGVPLLSTPPEEEAAATRYETSEAVPTMRHLVVPAAELPAFRTLTFVLPVEEDRLHALAPLADPWRAFVETYLLDLQSDASAARLAGVLNVLRSLRIEGTVTLLRRLLEQEPRAEIAKFLLESGDPAGISYFVEELRSDKPEARITAAATLCEAGRREGAEALLEDLRGGVGPLRSLAYRVLNGLDRYLQRPEVDAEVRDRVLDLFLGLLSDPTFQYRAFLVVERELHRDFGYGAARAITDPERRRKALEAAAAAAQSFWADSRPGKPR